MGKTYTTSDWHGIDVKLIETMLKTLNADDTLCVLGDVIDRGSDGLKLLDIIMADPRIKMLKGNHEEFMLKYQTDKWCKALWIGNGGQPTIDALEQKTAHEREAYMEYLHYCPTQLYYWSKEQEHVVIMEHAGYTPGIHHSAPHDPLWDRQHFLDPWNNSKKVYKKVYIVHGHTPVQYLKFEYDYYGRPKVVSKQEMEMKRQWFENDLVDWKPTIIRYCDGHKFDIDMGTAASNRIALLDLDTFEEIYFDKKEGE